MDHPRSDPVSGASPGIVEGLAGTHAALLRRAYDEGVRAFGSVSLPLLTFCRHAIERLCRRLARSRLEPTSERVRQGLEQVAAADLYLAVACQEGVEGAWETFTRRYVPQLRALLIERGVPEPEADELARNLPGDLVLPPVHGRTRTHLETYDGLGSLFSWTATIVLRRRADRVRRRKADHPESAPAEGNASPGRAPGLPRVTLDPAEVAADTETCQRLNHALDAVWPQLTVRERLALLYRYRLDLAQKDIARILSVSEPRVSGLLRGAVEKIKAAVHRAFSEDRPQPPEDENPLWKRLGDILGKHLKEPHTRRDHGGNEVMPS